jgi:hypothetical protein
LLYGSGELTESLMGSLMRQIRIENFLQFIRELINCENPGTLAEALKKEIYNLLPSSKHMSGRCLGRLVPTPSLKYKNVALAN